MTPFSPRPRHMLACAVALLAGLGSLSGGAAVASADDHVASALPGFAAPPMSARANNRGGTTADATTASATLSALAKAGFGSAEMGYAASPAGQTALTTVLDKASALGMKVNLNGCGSTSCSSPAVTLASSMQELLPFAQTVTTGTDNQAYSAAPPAATGVAGSPVLVAVTAAKVTGTSGTQTLLDPDTAVDLTANVSGGTLTWTVPTAGTWKLFAFYSRATGQFAGFPPFEDPAAWTGRDPAGGAGQYLADIFQTQGVADSLDLVASSVLGAGNGTKLSALGGDVFHDSIEVQAEMFWTADLASQFQALRGYSMIKYLPVLHNFKESSFNPLLVANFTPLPAPDYDFTGGVGDRVRYDYARTLTDLYVNRYVKGMNDWAHAHGLKSRQEIAYNYPQLDMIRASAAVDIPETESFDLAWGKAYDNTLPEYPSDRWRYFVDADRLAGSGAHIAGNQRVTMEWGDDFAVWRKGPQELADLMNAAIAGGVTQPSFAGFGGVSTATYPTPGGLNFIGFGDIITSNWPQWRDFNPLMTYLARSTVLVESGKPRVDVTVYHDRGISSLKDGNVPLWRGRALTQRGYTYDFVDPVDLTSADAGAVPTRLFGDGADYHALVVDQRSSIPADAAQAIRRYADAGLPVVFVGAPPAHSDGLRDAAANDAAVVASMAAIQGLDNVKVVATEDDVPGALAAIGVAPGASFSGDGADLQTVHRRTATDDAFWVYNPTGHDITTTGSFAAAGQPYALDLWNGTSTKLAAFDVGGGRTSVPVVVPAHGSIGLTIARGDVSGAHAPASAGADVRYGDDGRPVATAPAGDAVTLGAWHLDVDEIAPSGHTDHSLDLASLADWRTIPELASAVGTSTYSTTITVPDAWLGAGRAVRLDLGSFVGAVRVYVNGQVAGEQTTPGWTRDVTGLLHAGRNALSVRLDTTLLNRNAQLRASGNPAYQTGPVPPLGQFAPTPVAAEASGLLGPVRLIPLATSAIDLNPPAPPAPPVTPAPPAGPAPVPPAAPHPAPKAKAPGKASGTFSAGRASTRVRTLKVTGLARGSKVTVTCAGKGCGRTTRSTAIVRNGVANLASTLAVKGKALRPGAKLTVRIVVAGKATRTITITIRRGLKPLIRTS
jgi:hypothetical protein